MMDKTSRAGGHRAASPITADQPARRRIADIELLRAVAICFVLIQHANFNLVFNNAPLLRLLDWWQFWPGVDIFFVISGFLVTRDLLERRRRVRCAAGHARWSAYWRVARGFWVRRAWRLWPVAWLWLALIVAGSAVWSDPPFLGPVAVNLKNGLAGVLFYANYALATNGFRPYGASFPYWSLSLEEQFYLLLPLGLALPPRALFAIAIAALVVQLPLAHATVYFFFRSDALLWGVILGLSSGSAPYWRCEPSFLRHRALAMPGMLLCLAGICGLANTGNTTPPFLAGSIAAVAAVLVWAASYDRDYLCPAALRPFALWLGARAYVLYVAHMPMFLGAAALAHHIVTPHQSLFSGAGNFYAMILVVPMLLIVVEVTHRCVEQPLRRVGSRMAGDAPRPITA